MRLAIVPYVQIILCPTWGCAYDRTSDKLSLMSQVLSNAVHQVCHLLLVPC